MAHPVIQAVGFTGSRRGRLALHALAQSRAQPIPVFAEVSSINPVFLLPAALRLRAAVMAQEFVDSVTLGGAICHCAVGTQGAPIGHTCHRCLK